MLKNRPLADQNGHDWYDLQHYSLSEDNWAHGCSFVILQCSLIPPIAWELIPTLIQDDGTMFPLTKANEEVCSLQSCYGNQTVKDFGYFWWQNGLLHCYLTTLWSFPFSVQLLPCHSDWNSCKVSDINHLLEILIQFVVLLCMFMMTVFVLLHSVTISSSGTNLYGSHDIACVENFSYGSFPGTR